MALLLSRQVKAELDDIWSIVAGESGSVDIADRVVHAMTETFLQISKYPNLGRRHDDLRKGLRSVTAWDLRRHLSRGGAATFEYSMLCTDAATFGPSCQ